MKNKKTFKVISIVALVLLIFFGTPLGGMAISYFQKTLAGMGQMTYTGEVDIIDIKVKSLEEIVVSVKSTDNTEADRVYQVYLYLDDTRWETPQEVSWAAEDIPDVKEKLYFTGLNLTDVTVVDAEVNY